MLKTVVVIDAGGRGAALVYKYSQSPHVGKIIAIPGNDLMEISSQKLVEVHTHLKTTSIEEIIAICKKERVDLIDVAQDNAVAVGLVDRLQKEGFMVFGPTQKAGEIEWNKAYAREFLHTLGLPQPEFYIFHSIEEGQQFLTTQPDQAWFIKAAGLAEGKGVLPANNNKEAVQKIVELQKFGDSAKTYLLEKWLKTNGNIAEEFSAFAISDGFSFKMLGYAQDHKRVFDGDKGENTGGMGVSTPPLVIDTNIKKQTEEIFATTFAGLQDTGRPYVGILYLGGIIIDNKVYIIEFNARWGDPEVEVILPAIKSDLYELVLAVLTKKLETFSIKIDTKSRVAVAVAAKGYPTDYSMVKGKEIIGLEKIIHIPHILLFGAGIKKVDKRYVVNGGRVFYIIGEGKDVLEARNRVYAVVKDITIEGNNMHYRKDIGWRDVARLEVKK